MKIILASGSPRRAKILRDLGVAFEIVKTDAPEVSYGDDPERTVRENALAKGRSLYVSKFLSSYVGCADGIGNPGTQEPRNPQTLKLSNSQTQEPFFGVLSADTIVWFGGRIYGKPRDLDEAKAFLRELSGQTHTVFTGVAFNGEVRVVKSGVKFRELSEQMIDEYVARVKPTDRAGAYDIDESGDLIVEGWTGSYENIMGLPVEPVKEWLGI